MIGPDEAGSKSRWRFTTVAELQYKLVFDRKNIPSVFSCSVGYPYNEAPLKAHDLVTYRSIAEFWPIVISI
jgi:hypothetical protein